VEFRYCARRCAFLLAAVLIACQGAVEQPSSAASSAPNLATNGVNATMSVDAWGGGYCANVTLANTSTSPVTSWTLVAALNGSTLNNVWGGTSSVSDGQLTLRPVDYNANIAPGASVSLGFCGTGGSTPTLQTFDVVGGGTGGPTSFTLTVSRAGAGSGTITSAPAGIACGATCSASYASGATVTLTAAAASGSTFAGWSGACTGTAGCTVSMTAARTVTATFDTAAVIDATASVNAGGAAAGSFVADAGFTGGSTYATTAAIDTSLVPSPVPPAAVFQTERYGEFTYTIGSRTPGSAQTVTLYFAESYWTAAGQRTFNVAINGATVLSAFDIYAAAGGANKGIARAFETTANASGQVIIQFSRAGGPDNPKISGITVAAGGSGGSNFILTAARAGTGSGTVAGGGISCGATCAATYASGAIVTLTATAASGSTFGGWSGACSGAGICAVTMTANRMVTATFTAQTTTYALGVTRAGTGSGTVTSNPAGISCGATCSASYTSGTSVTLTAAAATGSTFGGWSGACTGTGSCIVTMTAARSVTATFNGSQPSTFTNPVLWEDLADIDIIRVDDTYYYSASTMHYSPGAPILRSYDLVNWEYAGHSVPVLDFSSAYDLSGGRAYVKGIWASFLNYRKSNRTFYWGGCIEFNRTYIYTATSVTGPWVKHGPLPCYYDAGLLIDDNDTMYVAYGATNISVAQLSADGFSQVRSQQVFTSPSSIGTLEGARFYKRNGFYYIWLTRPANGQYVLRSTSPWGPYTIQQVLLNMGTPVAGSGVPHQGGLVQTQNGDWYYMAFVDAFPGGRVPVLAPIDWVSDWPVIRTVNGAWGATYPRPNLPPPPRAVKPPTGTDTFTGTALGPEWEWNHNPDNTRWSVGSGLRLQTATVTNDLYMARNTLTHRILGPTSTATIVLNHSGMRDGDRAGLSLFRDLSAWVGVRRDAGATRVAFVNNINMNSSWATVSTGTEVTSAPVSGGRIWLRLAADIRPGTGRQGRFSYSTDGVNYTQIGTYTMGNAWQFFMGYRYGIFNYATTALGGSVTVESFTVSTP